MTTPDIPTDRPSVYTIGADGRWTEVTDSPDYVTHVRANAPGHIAVYDDGIDRFTRIEHGGWGNANAARGWHVSGGTAADFTA